jgi:hypothetical protein
MLPTGCTQHRHGDVGHADALADQPGTEFGREVLGAPAELLGAVDQETPAIPAVDGEECRAQVWLLDEIERGGAMRDPLGEVGVEQDIDAVIDLLLADHPHAERAADAALRALGGDQIACLEGRLRSCRPIGQDARDGVGAFSVKVLAE